MDRKPIKSTLSKMKVGEIEYFPLDQYASVSNMRYRDLQKERAEGYKWKVSADLNKKLTKVERVM